LHRVGNVKLKITKCLKNLETVSCFIFTACTMITGFPRGIEKVLNFKIGFQDLEKVLNFAKMYIRYWKSVEILYGKV